MSAKERQKLRSKGIFTVTQLSYKFRPRRRPKRLRDKREKYHHSLKALAIREKKLGPEHPDVAADAAALAAILDGQGKREEAEALFRRALNVFERIYGPHHYEVAVNLNNLGALHQAKRRVTDGRGSIELHRPHRGVRPPSPRSRARELSTRRPGAERRPSGC